MEMKHKQEWDESPNFLENNMQLLDKQNNTQSGRIDKYALNRKSNQWDDKTKQSNGL